MEKEFIPYEQALDLKELSFDEPCFGHWNYNNGKINYWYDEEIQNERTNKCILDSEKQFPKMNKNGCTAPTYSQAFRWFREKYQIDSWIYPNLNGLYSVSNVRRGVGLGKVSEYQTYEEAELECLKKLIEIVNEKV